MNEPPTRQEIPPSPEDIDEPLPCLWCDGPLEIKGCLGWRAWFRCRNCGMDYGREIPRPAAQHSTTETGQ